TVAGQTVGTVVSWYVTVTNGDGLDDVYPGGGASAPASWTVAGTPPPSEDPDKLLLSEICTLGTDQEFVEISNPNDYEVDMTDYYLTDSVHSSNQYWMITQPNPENFVGGGAFNDFYARFPEGFTIAAGDTIVMTVPGSTAFSASYGFLPDLELYEDDAFPDNVPDMRPLWGSGTSSSIRGDGLDPTLTNGGEGVVLLHWDGVSPLITDIDVFNWKDPGYTSSSFLFSKTGVTVGGETYGPDTDPGSQHPFALQLSF
ncbi:lamin tail domain-containing protein, partial [bacterium]|nr:lamin tail domain-containing protein [bacterium]